MKYFITLEMSENTPDGTPRKFTVEITPELYEYLLQKIIRLTEDQKGEILGDEF